MKRTLILILSIIGTIQAEKINLINNTGSNLKLIWLTDGIAKDLKEYTINKGQISIDYPQDVNGFQVALASNNYNAPEALKNCPRLDVISGTFWNKNSDNTFGTIVPNSTFNIVPKCGRYLYFEIKRND